LRSIWGKQSLQLWFFYFCILCSTTTGNALSDFVTGQVSTMEQDTPYHSLNQQLGFCRLFARQLSCLAKRHAKPWTGWDLQTSPVESQDLAATFVPEVQSTKVPGAPLGQLFPVMRVSPRGLAPNRYHHVSPRVGIAWDPWGDGKTAVRAAAGVFYGSVSGNEWNQPANAQPFPFVRLSTLLLR